MFSFFKKKPKFTVRVKEYDSVRYVAGTAVQTSRRAIKKDANSLQKSFSSLREKIEERSNPSGTLVISTKADESGSYSYFVGDLCDIPEQDDELIVKELKPGKYAHVTVDFKDPSALTIAVAKAKHFFYIKWLPDSGYRIDGDIESIEFYDRRSNIALASMDLVFPVIEK